MLSQNLRVICTYVIGVLLCIFLATENTHASVEITSSDTIQTLVDSNPEGTTFLLKSGVYRSQEILPKNGNVFIGEPGAILNGSRLLNTFTREGMHWVAPNQTQQGRVHGVCEKQPDMPRSEGCKFPEDVFMNDKPLLQVTRLSEVKPGTWFFDYNRDKIYLAENPAGNKIEVSVMQHAIKGAAKDVTVRDLIIEKYANPAQQGAIHAKQGTNGPLSRNWHIEGVELRLNHGSGIRVGHSMKLIANNIHHNGQLGIGGRGDDIVVENNVIAFNNTQGFSAGWEAGGAKFVGTRNLVVRGNIVQNNMGPGLWTDDNNVDTLYEGNRILENDRAGIVHMTSYDAVIRNNWVKGNGFGFSRWLWGAGILIHSSPNVEIHGNTLIDNANGISAIQQNAGVGGNGPYQIKNLFVHDNHISMSAGQSGLVQDVGDMSYFSSRNNRFTNNSYSVPDGRDFFRWMTSSLTWSEWNAFGQDVTGAIVLHESPVVVDQGLAVHIKPGENIQAKVDNHPEGTLFLIKSGLHRLQQIVPKNDNAFLGENGAILSGAKRLTKFIREGLYWVVENQIQQGLVEHSKNPCVAQPLIPKPNGCRHPEDLFIDDVPLFQVTSLQYVEPGKWFFDYQNDKIYFIDSPIGRKVETSITEHAFEGDAKNVLIRNLIIEKYANPAREGAIHAKKATSGPQSRSWRVENTEVRLNHGWGIRAGDAMKITESFVHHNGQLGIGGTGENIILIRNEISYNNTQGFNSDFETGGTKFLKTSNLRIIGNVVHHNIGCGLWTDIDNTNILYEANHVFDNARCGIYHEVGHSALIKHNLTERNGFGYPFWLWGSGIVAYSSDNVEIHSNIVSDNKGGIAGIQQNRINSLGKARLRNLHVHHNFISLSKGTGIVSDERNDNAVFHSQNNRFEHNSYILGDLKSPFRWLRTLYPEDSWQAFGNDQEGSFSRIN